MIVREDCVLTFKFERQAPVSAHADCPVISKVASETMEPPSGGIHVFGPLGIVKREQLQAKLIRMLWLDAGFRSCLKEPFQATVAEAPDHCV